MKMAAARVRNDIVVAFQFLTRLPVPRVEYEAGSLARAVKWFPLVGLVVGAGAAGIERLLRGHIAQPVVAWIVVLSLVAATGCFHEDALADTADSFGGWTKEKRLAIMRDSRIGSYGAAALVLSLGGRVLLLTYLPVEKFAAYVIVAQVLCRWSTLPLSYFVAPARVEEGMGTGLGASIARLTSRGSLLWGSVFSFVVAGVALHRAAIAPVLLAALLTAVAGRFFARRLGGVTGDCFGAVNQLTEIAVYLCGVWR